MAVVVLFLGLRTGLIVGAIVPTTVLGTLAIMKLLNIDLHIISVGAIIIALGLFVDNAIVVAEDMWSAAWHWASRATRQPPKQGARCWCRCWCPRWPSS